MTKAMPQEGGGVPPSPADEREIRRLQARLEELCQELAQVEENKRSSTEAFTSEIKELKAEVGTVLADLRGARTPSPQPSLPLAPPQPVEGEKTCSLCHHTFSAHYDENGAPRPCVVAGCGCSNGVAHAGAEG